MRRYKDESTMQQVDRDSLWTAVGWSAAAIPERMLIVVVLSYPSLAREVERRRGRIDLRILQLSTDV
jgi:hypothetical protein